MTSSIVLLLLLNMSVSVQKTLSEPKISWLKTVAEPAVRDALKDPESARFEWPYHFQKMSDGWETCGYVNSKNSFGGYTGKNFVLILFRPAAPPKIILTEYDDPILDRATWRCNNKIKNNQIAPRQL